MRTGGGFDPDAQAFFDRVTTAGGTLSTTEKNATNQLVLDMKSAGIWSSMKAVYPMVGASAAACAQNLKSSSFTGTFTSGWTFASTGVTPNGTSAYMDTGVNPNSNLSQNSTHISFYSRTDTDGIYIDIGAGNLHLFPRFGNTFYPRVYSTGYNVSNSSSLGFFMGNRTTVNDVKGQKNNTITNFTSSFSSSPDLNIYIGAYNSGAGVADFFSTRQCAFSSIGDGLTDTQASNFYTAVQAFQTTLARQIAP